MSFLTMEVSRCRREPEEQRLPAGFPYHCFLFVASCTPPSKALRLPENPPTCPQDLSPAGAREEPRPGREHRVEVPVTRAQYASWSP
jgi:hypothetical protein